MLYAPPMDRSPALHSVATIAAATRDERTEDPDRFDVTRRIIPSPLKVGDTSYPLRSPLLGTFYPGHGGLDGEFVVPEFFPDFVGRGRNFNQAFLDWRDRIHGRFQELYSRRPFELTESEKATWQLLESRIDVTIYRQTTPLMIRQIGKVTRARPHPERIEWEDGLTERVQLDQMPGEFVTYRPGQPFEAIVARDPVDFRLLKVTHIQRTKPLPQVSREEIGELIRSIPTTSSLPDADWD